MQIIAGTGANSTSEAIELTKEAIDYGADATLQVTPYYNKPTSEGLFRHFTAVADLGLPVVLYNVPGRTSKEIPIDVIKRLSEHPKIAAIKEAGGDAGRVSQIHAVCDLEILSGDDALTLPMMSVGALGVISVASNIIPHKVVEMVNSALANDFAKARAVHRQLSALFTDLFIEVNPIPVKAAMAMMGQIEEIYRLPLCEMAAKNREKLYNTMYNMGLIK